jgi:hypothetical protein
MNFSTKWILVCLFLYFYFLFIIFSSSII